MLNHECPCRKDNPHSDLSAFRFHNKPDEDFCDYCGSLNPDTFMKLLEEGKISLDPTDKNYKVYVCSEDDSVSFTTYHRIDGEHSMDQDK